MALGVVAHAYDASTQDPEADGCVFPVCGGYKKPKSQTDESNKKQVDCQAAKHKHSPKLRNCSLQ